MTRREELTDKMIQLGARLPMDDAQLLAEVLTEFVDQSAQLPMLLWCPMCGSRHIDKGEFATKPHHTHACQNCGLAWRPAVVHTVGVQHLPGFKDP